MRSGLRLCHVVAPLEFDLGIFVPGTDLGGGYRMMRQYQVPGRPELGRIADGTSGLIEEIDVDPRGSEIGISPAPARVPL